MKPSIAIHRYELVSRHQLSARAERLRYRGALIRLGEKSFGYGCIHPWTELGDSGLDETLELLKVGETTRNSARALACAEEDRDARERGVRLWDGIDIPESHATLPLCADAFAAAWAAGFRVVKVKLGRDLEREAQSVCLLAERYRELRWRFDFNHSCAASEVAVFLNQLGAELCCKIDFMEDAWLESEVVHGAICGVPVAIDRFLGASASTAPYQIIKPAINDPEPLLMAASQEGKKVLFTSYMDHPLGQSFAAWQAGVYAARYPGVVVGCGLVTHGLFVEDAFTKALGEVRPSFQPAGGRGLGFDHLFDKILWEPLI